MEANNSFGFGDLGFFNPVENTELTITGTVAPELPIQGYDISPRDFSVASGYENTSGSVSGVLGMAKAGADSLFRAWGTVQEYKSRADQMDLQRAQSAADVTIRKAQLDAATTREVATATLEKQRAESAMNRAANMAQGGTGSYASAVSALPVVLGLVVLGFAVFGTRRKGQK
jgi:hypothetical protein